jgi:hypothetical protein
VREEKEDFMKSECIKREFSRHLTAQKRFFDELWGSRETDLGSVSVPLVAPGMLATIYQGALSATGRTILWTWRAMNPLIQAKYSRNKVN